MSRRQYPNSQKNVIKQYILTKFIIYWIIFWTIHFNLTFIFIADYKSKCTIKVTSGYNVNKILLSFHEFIEIVLLCWGFSLGTKFEITNDLLFFSFLAEKLRSQSSKMMSKSLWTHVWYKQTNKHTKNNLKAIFVNDIFFACVWFFLYSSQLS